MIWTLIFIGILIIGIVCIVVGNYLGHSFEGLLMGGIFTTAISGFILVVFIGVVIGANATAEIEYPNKLHNFTYFGKYLYIPVRINTV